MAADNGINLARIKVKMIHSSTEYARDIEEISASQKDIIMQVFKECLPPQPQLYGRTHLIKHKIRVKPDATPVRHKLRRMSPNVLNLATEEAKKWLKLGIVEFLNSS